MTVPARATLTLLALLAQTATSGPAHSAPAPLIDCDFPIRAQQERAGGTPEIAVSGFRSTYLLDRTTGRMSARDGDAVYPVRFYRGVEAITILHDANLGGNLSTVTVVIEGPERGRAVYNRLTMIAGGRLIPSQHYGTCRLPAQFPIPQYTNMGDSDRRGHRERVSAEAPPVGFPRRQTLSGQVDDQCVNGS